MCKRTLSSSLIVLTSFADRPRRIGVHYGGGKHAILLTNPETFAKVRKCYCSLFHPFPLMLEVVGHHHRSLLQRRHHNDQALDLAALPPTLPPSWSQNHHLGRQRLRHQHLVDHYLTDHFPMSTDSRSVGSFCKGPMSQTGRSVYRIRHLQYHQRYDRPLPAHAANLAIAY